MSNDNPPPIGGEPDPFAELLKGLAEEPPPQPPTQPVAPVPNEPPAPIPAVPGRPSGPPSSADVPTVAMPAPNAANAPNPPSGGEPPADIPTVVLPGAYPAPTAATTVLPGGYDVPPPEQPGAGGGYGGWDPRRKALFWVLIGVAAALLVALVILLVMLFSPKGGAAPTSSPTRPAPSSSPTPSRTPSSTPTPTPTATAAPAVQSFTVTTNTSDPTIEACTDQSSTLTVKLAWTTIGAKQVAIKGASGFTDALDSPDFNNLPATATNYEMPFPCSQPSWTYTLTMAGADGEHRSGVLTVTRQYNPPAPPTPTLDSFAADPTAISCDYSSDPAGVPQSYELSWSGSNWVAGDYVVLGIANPGEYAEYTDASKTLASGTDFPALNCGDGQQTYYLTLFDGSGTQLAQRSATVTVTGE